VGFSHRDGLGEKLGELFQQVGVLVEKGGHLLIDLPSARPC
jgi:hypothetical protein